MWDRDHLKTHKTLSGIKKRFGKKGENGMSNLKKTMDVRSRTKWQI